MKVLQGTIHQGNNLLFPIHYGVQCCSASVVACAYALSHNPTLWTAKDIDACVYLGTNIHAKSCRPNYNGYLFPHEIIKTFPLPNKVHVVLEAAKEAKFIGAIHNIEGFGDEIIYALTSYFKTSRCGILNCNEYSFGMMFAGNEFWIFDSHAKDITGRSHHEGFAVLISFSSINELVQYLQQNFNDTSTYSITEIKFKIQNNEPNLLTCPIDDSSQNQPGSDLKGDSYLYQPNLFSCPLGDSSQNQPGTDVKRDSYTNQPDLLSCPLGDSSQNQPGTDVKGDSYTNQPDLLSCPLGDSSQNQPGTDVKGDSYTNQPDLLSCPLGDSFQNQPGTDVKGDSYTNQPNLLFCPLGDSSQNQPGTDVKIDSYTNQPNLLFCPLGDSLQNQPGTDIKTEFYSNQPNLLCCPLGDSFQNQPGSHKNNDSFTKSRKLYGTGLKSLQISQQINKKRKLQIKLENSRKKKALVSVPATMPCPLAPKNTAASALPVTVATKLNNDNPHKTKMIKIPKASALLKTLSKKQIASKQYYVDKLKNNQEFKEKNLSQVKSRLKNDAGYKLRNLQNVKDRLENDDGYKSRNLQNVKNRLENDESYKLRNLQNVKNRLENDESYKLRNLQNVKNRLENDENYKLKNLQNVKNRLENDESYKLRNLENVRKRLKVDVNYQENTSLAKRKYYEEKLKCNTEKYTEQLSINKKHKHIKENDSIKSTQQQVIDEYFAEIKEGPTWRYLIAQNTPNNAIINGLSFPSIPHVLQGLTQLEERLLAVRQPFMKIIELSKYAGPQYGLKGSCVNVPTELNSTVSILPRNLSESETILIKLQRKMEDKVPYSYDLIRPERVYKAAEFLVQTEIYKKHNITLNTNWLHDAENPIEVITVDNENISGIDNTENDLNEVIDTNIKQSNSDQNSTNKKFQKQKHNKFEEIFFDNDSDECSSSSDSSDSETETGNHETMVMPDILPDHITNDIGIKIAPGENQIPISLLQDEDVDILTYPSIYCGKARQFKHKLTDTQLRKFELKSSDRRAAKHIPKLFMSFCKSRLRRFL
ncbi:41 kDa spicule matrix protein [Frankliniella fusca]|uniref:41 kDa spicule matrix protein n=1 Tax=Frankliniella fusca TaxID=407009 RepID=A0AAE1H6V1_9NEOP|nr:41 kDa spicule matrix protein [Frankliniella fusca]